MAIVSGISLSVRNSRFSKSKAVATRYAQEAVETFRNYRDEVGWEPFKTIIEGDGSNPLYCVPTLPADSVAFELLESGSCQNEKILLSGGADTEFWREISVSLFSSPNEGAELSVMVYWNEGTKTHDVTLVSRLSSWAL
ncbi:hypothetical protein ACFL1M_00070 [Patescibacteria group bacterium]